MVDGKIYKFKQIEKSELDLRSAAHKSLISCEVRDWDGGKISSDPIFVVDIRSRQGSDGGAEYCSEIAKAVKELLDEGFGSGNSAVAVSEIRGNVRYEKALIAYRCQLEVFGHIKITYSLSLYPSAASPQPAGTEIVFTAVAFPAERLEYRFLVEGPGTGNQWRDMTGWTSRNSCSWRPSNQDAGVSTMKVQVRGGKNRIVEDQEATTGFSITPASGGGGGGSLPSIIGLYPTLASPRGQGTKIDFICIASDTDNDPIYYRFYLTGPGTASRKKIVQDWSQKNSWSWSPTKEDIGTNTIEVQIRDGKHASAGGYDASQSISYTVSSNTAPTIGCLYVNESGIHYVGDKLHVVADASDADGDKILHKFWVYRETVGGVWEQLTGWQEKNWVLYEIDKMDFEMISFKVQVRDGKHAGEESFDAEESGPVDIARASLTSLTPSLASPQAHENTIVFTAVANKTMGIYYRFWQKGPGTAAVWRDMTGWQQKNSWSWRTLACDIGTTNQVKVQVCDDPDEWMDSDTTAREITVNYTIS